ncbi:MAG: HAD family phosphatase [Lachnospiraceae bacterium]|nr:HAD family phosphatase [Lachnospiraceae bacterium]
MTEIKNIVFDVGNVLVEWNPEKVMREQGMTEEEIKEFDEKIFKTGIWDKSDEGILTKAEFVKSMTDVMPGCKEKIESFFENIRGALTVFDYTENLIKKCKEAGFNVYILSNYSEWAYDQTRDYALSFLPLVDGALFSYAVKLIKPDDKIYEELLKMFSINSGESIFLDDRIDNVEAAKRNGINSFVFTGLNQALEELANYGVEINL